MIEPGTVLFGKYRIEDILGKGGMGVVMRAHHLQLDQPVAIKLLLPEVLDNRIIVQRFLREAQAAVKLRSEHVARVHDVGTLESGAPYMVMEYLDGVDLGDILRQQGPLAPGMAVDLILQACEGLAEAHVLGIVHRDIKPSNLFVIHRPDGSPLVKVLDFGISKAPGVGQDEDITSTEAVMGTPSYMSPEQMRSSKHVDARTDIWALGVVLYEALTGRRPFVADSFAGVCLQVVMEPPPPLDIPLPSGLAEIVARCLEKQPDSRIQDMAELAAALEPYARTASGKRRYTTAPLTTLIDAGLGRVTDTPPTTLGASVAQSIAVPRRHQRAGLMAAGAGLFAAAAILGGVLARDSSRGYAGGEAAFERNHAAISPSPAAIMDEPMIVVPGGVTVTVSDSGDAGATGTTAAMLPDADAVSTANHTLGKAEPVLQVVSPDEIVRASRGTQSSGHQRPRVLRDAAPSRRARVEGDEPRQEEDERRGGKDEHVLAAEESTTTGDGALAPDEEEAGVASSALPRPNEKPAEADSTGDLNKLFNSRQ